MSANIDKFEAYRRLVLDQLLEQAKDGWNSVTATEATT
jgi:hypothetical protein